MFLYLSYGRKFANQEDEDTDEGTSFEIAERHAEHDVRRFLTLTLHRFLTLAPI